MFGAADQVAHAIVLHRPVGVRQRALAHLVVQAVQRDVVRRPVSQYLGHDEERDPPVALGRVVTVDLRQHEMHNVLEAVVVKTGGPHLAAAQAVLVATDMARLCFEVAQTRSALRLGQGHRAPKSTLYQWSHIRLLLFCGPVGFDQIRGAVRQRIKAA